MPKLRYATAYQYLFGDMKVPKDIVSLKSTKNGNIICQKYDLNSKSFTFSLIQKPLCNKSFPLARKEKIFKKAGLPCRV